MNAFKLAMIGMTLTIMGSMTTGCVIAYPRRERVWVPVYHPVPVRPILVVR